MNRSAMLRSCLFVCALLCVLADATFVESSDNEGSQSGLCLNHLPLIVKDKPDDGAGCNCRGNMCGCCAAVEYPKLGINASGCANITWEPTKQELNVLLIFNDKVLLNQTVSVHNPPPLCAGLPHVATWCTIFYNVSVSSTSFQGCLRYELRLLGQTILRFPVGCFKFPGLDNKKLQSIQTNEIELFPAFNMVENDIVQEKMAKNEQKKITMWKLFKSLKKKDETMNWKPQKL